MKTLVPAVLVAFVLGAVAGLVAARRSAAPAGAPEAAGAGGPKESAPGVAAGKTDAPSPALEVENRALREKIARLEKGSAVSPADLDRRAKDLMKEIPGLLAKKDGKGLLRILRDLSACGEAGWPAALKLAEILQRDIENGGAEYGANPTALQGILQGSPGMLEWALRHPDDVTAWMRQRAVGPLMWQVDPDPGTLFSELLRSEKDPQVAQALAGGLMSVARAGSEAALLDAAKRQSGDAGRSLVAALSGLGTPEAIAGLRELAASPDPAIRDETAYQLLVHDPPAAGVLISGLVPKSQAEAAGLKRGDLVVSYNGVPVTQFEQLRGEVDKTNQDQLVPIVVQRGSEMVTLQIRGQQIGIYGDEVTPMK